VIYTIAEAARLSEVPAGTIRRWLSEGRLRRFGEAKPYRVHLGEVSDLRDTLARGSCASRPDEQSCR